MPIHFEDRDFFSEIQGLKSLLIVPCYMCPAITVAVRENRPFIEFFRHFLKSAPFDQYLKELQARIKEHGVESKVFKSPIYHQWFMCMWTAHRRKKLLKLAKKYDAILVLGCESATETVRDATKSIDCKLIEGMKVTGIMNAHLSFKLPGNVSFANCKIISISENERSKV